MFVVVLSAPACPLILFLRFAYAVLSADELVAVANTIRFEYNDGRTFLRWNVGMGVDPAIWIGLFLVIVIVINCFPVRVCA